MSSEYAENLRLMPLLVTEKKSPQKILQNSDHNI